MYLYMLPLVALVSSYLPVRSELVGKKKGPVIYSNLSRKRFPKGIPTKIDAQCLPWVLPSISLVGAASYGHCQLGCLRLRLDVGLFAVPDSKTHDCIQTFQVTSLIFLEE